MASELFFAALWTRDFLGTSAILFAELSLLQLRFLNRAGQATGVPGKNHEERRSNPFDFAPFEARGKQGKATHYKERGGDSGDSGGESA